MAGLPTPSRYRIRVDKHVQSQPCTAMPSAQGRLYTQSLLWMLKIVNGFARPAVRLNNAGLPMEAKGIKLRRLQRDQEWTLDALTDCPGREQLQ